MNHIIYNNDCDNILKDISDNTIQCIISSPPYSIGKSYDKKQSFEKYLEEYVPRINHFYRILTNSGSIFWQVGNWVKNGEILPLDIPFYNLFHGSGFKLRNRIIWHFGHGLHCKKRFSGRYETILYFTKSDDYIFNLDFVRVAQKYPNKKYYKGSKKGQLSCNPLGSNPNDVWNISNVKHNHPEKTIHPCSFPIALCERCILVSTNEGDTVLDPFCGSGQAIIAAVKNNRKCIGIELNKEYAELSERRLHESYKTI